MYDQHYWAKRVQQLKIGSALAPGTPTTDCLRRALEAALLPEVAARARRVGAHAAVEQGHREAEPVSRFTAGV